MRCLKREAKAGAAFAIQEGATSHKYLKNSLFVLHPSPLRIKHPRVAFQAIFPRWIVIFTTLLGIAFSHAAFSNIPSHSFDFSKKITQVLKDPIETVPGRDNTSSGRIELAQSGEDGEIWGAVRGSVSAPLEEVLDLLYDHETTRGARIAEMKVRDYQTQDPSQAIHHQVHYVVKPFLFVAVEWDVDYSYTMLEGTRDDPKLVLITYEKTQGTSHISHLAGNILLSRISPNVTDAFMYEEVKATGRTEEDTIRGLEGTLQTIREKIKK